MPPKGSCVRGSGPGMTAGHGRIPRRQGLPSGMCLTHRRHALADRESAVLSSSLCCWFAGTAGLPLSLQCETPFLQMPKTMESPDLKNKLPEPLLYVYLPCCDKILWPKELREGKVYCSQQFQITECPRGKSGQVCEDYSCLLFHKALLPTKEIISQTKKYSRHHGGCWLIVSSQVDLDSAKFLIQFRTTWLGMVTPTVGLAFLHQINNQDSPSKTSPQDNLV